MALSAQSLQTPTRYQVAGLILKAMTEAVGDETTDLLNTVDRWDALVKDMRAELRDVVRGFLRASPQFMKTRGPVRGPSDPLKPTGGKGRELARIQAKHFTE